MWANVTMPPELTTFVQHGAWPSWRVWWTAIRPRTLTIALTPVLLGTALAWADGFAKHWAPALVALACAVLIQIGTNLHNDVRDFERGNDRPDRVGPLRVTAAGWVSTAAMHRATALTFGLAMLLGLYLVVHGGWPILLAGLASVLAGWSYSGGRHPISHTPFGEVFVLVFFGWVAVMGSYWLQTAQLSVNAWLCGTALGLPAAAVLLVNNYRDLPDDLRSGRRTLAAWLGLRHTRTAYATMLLLPHVLALVMAMRDQTGATLGLLLLPPSIQLVKQLQRDNDGPALNALLANTAKAGLMLGLLWTAGLFL